jgi:hypothetical protein
MAVVRQDGGHVHIIHLSELTHRGAAIRKKLDQRSNYRRRRRTANLWYRKKRFDNRTRPKGWLPPSLRSRVEPGYFRDRVSARHTVRVRGKGIPVGTIWQKMCLLQWLEQGSGLGN